MSWIYLVFAGVFEVVGVTMINSWHKNRNWQSMFMMFAGFGASLSFLSLAMEELPMGTAYAIWTGIGAAGGTIIGMMLYGEPKDWKRLLFIMMVLGSAIGLKAIS